jgi:hypothetical protein
LTRASFQSLPATLSGSIPGRLPPCALVTGTVDLAVVHAAERDDVFIARLASQCARLRIAKMMRIGWHTAAD